MPTTAQSIFQELADLRTAFDTTRALLIKGMRVDLSGMDERVRDFCAHAQASDSATRQQIEPDFAALLAQLNELESELRRRGDHAKFAVTATPADSTAPAAKADPQNR